MTMKRADLVEFFSDVIRFGSIVASSLGSSKSTQVQLDDNPRPNVEVWGHAPLLYKPLAGCETLCVQLGDENVVVCTKDRRFQIEVADGEVIVRAMGAAAGYIHLKPDGSILLGGTTATFSFVKGQALKAYIDVVNTAISTALGTIPTVGAATKAAFDLAIVGANTTQWPAALSALIKGK